MLRRYVVEVREVLSDKYDIDASSEDEAISIVQDMYYNEEIILDYDDLDRVEFNIAKGDD